jgi:hypothetical protein
MDLTLGMRAGAIGFEPAPAETIQDRFGHDRARRIAGAEEKDVVDLSIGHDFPLAKIVGFALYRIVDNYRQIENKPAASFAQDQRIGSG